MADEQTASKSSRSSKSAKAALKMGGPTEDGIAPVAGEYADDRPAEEKPGDPAHLGSDRPYEGEDLQVGRQD